MERDLSTASWLDEPARANAADGRRPAVDGLLVAVARRICGQAERQLAIAEWLRQQADRADLADRSAELALAARRILRDGESLLVVGGGSPERGGAVPTGLGRILADVVAAADDPSRVLVAQVPSAALAQSSAIGAGQVLVELVGHARRLAPDGARIELVGRWAGDGGVTIEVQVEGVDIPWQEAAALENELAGGPDGPIPPERLGLHLAARLARSCGARVEVQTPIGEPSTPGYGIVALVRFPRELVEPAPSVGSRPAEQPPAPPSPPQRSASALDYPAAATAQPHTTASELFGSFSSPLAGADDDLSGTPIFAAVASAWFRTSEDAANGYGGINGSGSNLVNGSGGGPGTGNGAWRPDEPAGSRRSTASEEWASASDDEWQAAARRAARAEEEEENLPTTASGLPRRTPGSRMVAPSLRSQAAPAGRTRGGLSLIHI